MWRVLPWEDTLMCEIWYDYVKGQNMCRLNTMLSQTTYKFNLEVEVTLFIYSLIINRNITKLKNKIKELSKSYNIKYITLFLILLKHRKQWISNYEVLLTYVMSRKIFGFVVWFIPLLFYFNRVIWVNSSVKPFYNFHKV